MEAQESASWKFPKIIPMHTKIWKHWIKRQYSLVVKSMDSEGKFPGFETQPLINYVSDFGPVIGMMWGLNKERF